MVSVAAVPAVADEPTQPEASFDDHAADFFREGETAPAMATLELDEQADAQGQADARLRRRAFSGHVMGVVALSVAVCIAAFVRSATGASAAAAATTITTATTTATTTAAAAVAVAELPRVAPLPTQPPAAPSAAPEAAVAPEAALAPVAARAAREDARRALDRGAAAAAITAGTQSVELDPTDADAWLILGAAYQLAGKGAEARSAFYSCSKLAKRGDVGECRALVP